MGIVSRQEDRDGHAVHADGVDDAEAVQLRHLDVQQHNVGPQPLDLAHCLQPRIGLASDLDVGHRHESRADATARE
jgi:hypothetical protein